MLASYLHECFRLDEEAGKLFWRRRPPSHFPTQHACNCWNARFADREAGTITAHGYRQVLLTFDGTKARLMVARVVYRMKHGEWPPVDVDHWNGDRLDNRPNNLKAATDGDQVQNRGMFSNNKSGFTGVSWFKDRRRWCAQIQVGGKKTYLGFFANPEDAYAAYCAAKAQLHAYRPDDRSVKC